ncbi:MAG: hypothetical protein KGL39_41295 [Patescibacteria group bacterium]|nr:hypothetical protein [Patescibacteria group bacterium]
MTSTAVDATKLAQRIFELVDELAGVPISPTTDRRRSDLTNEILNLRLQYVQDADGSYPEISRMDEREVQVKELQRKIDGLNAEFNPANLGGIRDLLEARDQAQVAVRRAEATDSQIARMFLRQEFEDGVAVRPFGFYSEGVEKILREMWRYSEELNAGARARDDEYDEELRRRVLAQRKADRDAYVAARTPVPEKAVHTQNAAADRLYEERELWLAVAERLTLEATTDVVDRTALTYSRTVARERIEALNHAIAAFERAGFGRNDSKDGGEA